MRITISALLLCLLCVFSARAQNSYSIKGSVADSSSNAKLMNTTISVLNAKDSILRKFTRVTENGSFTINNLPKGKFILMATYPGYADYIEPFTIDSVKKQHDFGKINLTLKSKLLADVIIKGQVAAIKIKGDTTEFNAAAYNIQPNSKVEDLLKQLPGIQVDKDGKITAQGQTVTKVLVDGEEFFGDDPTLVTKNIRGDMVDKVQLYDKKSDQAAFTGIDDGEKTKTINIQLKDDKKNGYFGKLDGNIGTDKYYQAQAMYNKFAGKKKFAVYGIAANTGKIGLSWGDSNKYGSSTVQVSDNGGLYITGGGSDLDSFDGQYNGRGLPVARTGGAHYDNKWDSDKKSVNTNYKIGSLGVDGTTGSISQNNLPTGIILNNSNQNYNNYIFRQKLDATYQTKLDSTSDIKLSVDGTDRTSKTRSNSTSTSTNGGDSLLNRNSRLLTNNVTSQIFNFGAFYTKKFKKVGRTFSLTVNQNINNSDADGFLNSRTDYFNTATPRTDTTNQHKINTIRSSAFSSNMTYTQPLAKRLSLILNYGINVNNSSADRKSLNLSSTGEYDELDTLYSNYYVLKQISNQGGAVFNYKTTKATLNLGTRINNVDYKQTDQYTGSVYKRNFINWNPQASYQYKFSQRQSLNIGYYGSTSQPSIDQIQPVRTNNDPLNITKGNPDLTPSYNSRFNASYNSYKVLTDQSIYASASYSFTSNPIVSDRSYDAGGVSTTQSINLGGKMPSTYSAYLDGSQKIKWIGLTADAGLNTSGGTSYARSNGALNVIKYSNYSFSFSLYKYVEKKYDISVSYGPNYSFNTSSLQPELNNNGGGANGRYYFYIYLPGKFQFESDGNYQFKKKTRVSDADYETFIINSSISKKFLKEDNLVLSISGNDIFDQNKGITRNTFSTTTFTTIKRYFMLTLTWDFNHMGGAAQPKK